MYTCIIHYHNAYIYIYILSDRKSAAAQTKEEPAGKSPPTREGRVSPRTPSLPTKISPSKIP